MFIDAQRKYVEPTKSCNVHMILLFHNLCKMGILEYQNAIYGFTKDIFHSFPETSVILSSKSFFPKINNIKRASCEMRKYQIYTKPYYMHQTNLFPFILVFGFYFGEN